MSIKVIEFEKHHIDDWKGLYGIQVRDDMSLEELTDYLEKDGMMYYYASYNHEDVIREYTRFKADTGRTCRLIELQAPSWEVYFAIL
jgi:hypothetical protein